MGRPVCLRCIDPNCRGEQLRDSRVLTCPACGGLLEVVTGLQDIDPDARSRISSRRGGRGIDRSGVWRFRELLPFDESELEAVATLAEGDTPQLECPSAAGYAGLDRLWVKHLGCNPTGSFKDYGMTVAVTRALLSGCSIVACASTGNTSASLAAYAARAGLQGAVLVPRGQVARGKLAQTIDYGAATLEVDGNFDRALAALVELSATTELYPVNSLNPYRLEGQKIVMAELAEEWNWELPDHLVIPGGNLGNAAAFGKGLAEMLQLGWIRKTPQLHIIQAEGSAPLAEMYARGATSLQPVDDPDTLATAIRIGRPVSWRKALATLRDTAGSCVAVSEAGIADARAVLAREGIGCEPASAAALEGARQLVAEGSIGSGDSVVVILTGHQLKDPDYLLDYHQGELRWKGRLIQGSYANQPRRVGADTGSIRAALGL